jgi:fatty acid desaturase
MSLALAPRPVKELNDPELLRRVNALRRTDNWTNWFYLAREYLFLAVVVGLVLAFYHCRAGWGLSWAWNLPATFLAVVLVGAGQHRLVTLAHEASHYMLFHNRLLNELASDWLCMFPMWGITHNYRLQHLAHHQFVNDPERDPDVAQMEASGHRFQFPMPPRRFVWECVIKQFLWLPNLIKYVRARARYSATANGTGPYRLKGKPSKALVVAGLLYVFALAGILTGLARLGDSWLLALVPAGMLAAVLSFYALVPERWYPQNTLKPDVKPRYWTLSRMTYLTGVFTALAWLSHLTDEPWGLYYLVLWMVPLATTYAFFMLLRQLVQHGNADRERLTNTRIFRVGRLIQFAVFPLGMDYHLPHHLFPMVPHYRLKRLHQLLLETEAYRREAPVVEGYFFHREKPPVHPTVLDVMAR